MYGRKPLSINTSICSLSNCAKSSSLQVMCVTSTVGSYRHRQLKLRWKWCDVGSFINLLVRVLYFSKIPFFRNNKLFGCFLSSVVMGPLHPWHFLMAGVALIRTGGFFTIYLLKFPGLGGTGPRSGLALCHTLQSSITSATSAMFATIASSSMSGAAPLGLLV